jgi:hypothetical protein
MRVRKRPKGCLPARFCGLARDKAAPDETGDAELLKFGETSNGIPSQARKDTSREGIETDGHHLSSGASGGGLDGVAKRH